MLADDAAAERWFTENRWKEGVYGPACGSVNIQERSDPQAPARSVHAIAAIISSPTSSVRCQGQGSNLGFHPWALAIYDRYDWHQGDIQHQRGRSAA